MFGVNFRILILALAMSFSALIGCAVPYYEEPNSTLRPASAACPFQLRDSNLCLSWQWEKNPPEGELGSLLFQVFQWNEKTQSAQLISLPGQAGLELYMPSMKHGSDPVFVENLAPGLYRASEIYFNMEGDWEMRFEFLAPNGFMDGVNVPIRR